MQLSSSYLFLNAFFVFGNIGDDSRVSKANYKPCIDPGDIFSPVIKKANIQCAVSTLTTASRTLNLAWLELLWSGIR